MKEKFTIQFSSTRLKQMKKIALSGSRAKLNILNGKVEEGFSLLKNTAKKLEAFVLDLSEHIPSLLAKQISVKLFSHFEGTYSKRLKIPKSLVLGGTLMMMASLPTVGQTSTALNTAQLVSQIDAANLDISSGTIFLPQGTIYLLTSSLPAVDDIATGGTLTIICTGSTNAIVDGADTHRPFETLTGADLRLSNITIQNGTSTRGGGIYNFRADLSISNCIVQNNYVTGSSGATTGRGGGIYSKGGGGATASVTISNSVITLNSSSVEGGGIFNHDQSVLTITTSTISGNISGHRGGGVYTRGANTADVATITNTTISGNSSATEGAGVWIFDSDALIEFCSIINNTATNKGGGISGLGRFGAPGHNIIIRNTTISGNSAGPFREGGGIFHSNNGQSNSITLQHVTLSDNTGQRGGVTGDGFANSGNGGTITIQNSIITNSTGTSTDFGNPGGATVVTTGSLVADGSLAGAISGNPLLGPLALSSGFMVHSITTGTSPAVDAAFTGAATANDQLGAVRAAPHDMGAVQFGGAPLVCMVVVAPPGVTTTWIGCTNTDWQTATNWSTGAVPTPSDVVYVPNAALNELIIDEVATCAKILVQFGAKCTVQYNVGGKLNVQF